MDKDIAGLMDRERSRLRLTSYDMRRCPAGSSEDLDFPLPLSPPLFLPFLPLLSFVPGAECMPSACRRFLGHVGVVLNKEGRESFISACSHRGRVFVGRNVGSKLVESAD